LNGSLLPRILMAVIFMVGSGSKNSGEVTAR
jgi:hypothetical protein